MEKGIIVHTVIYNKEGKVLILKRSEDNDVLPGYWDLPGGTLEDGEDPADGAIREAKEETDLEVIEPSLFFYTSKIDKDKNKQFVTLIFTAEYSGGNVNINPEEHDDYDWINKSEVDKYQVVDYLEECLKEAEKKSLI